MEQKQRLNLCKPGLARVQILDWETQKQKEFWDDEEKFLRKLAVVQLGMGESPVTHLQSLALVISNALVTSMRMCS